MEQKRVEKQAPSDTVILSSIKNKSNSMEKVVFLIKVSETIRYPHIKTNKQKESRHTPYNLSQKLTQNDS